VCKYKKNTKINKKYRESYAKINASGYKKLKSKTKYSEVPEKVKNKYQDKAAFYVEAASKDFFEKWDNRGCWFDDGPYGSYIGFNRFLDPGQLTRWITNPEVSRAGLSHPFNKQMDVAQVCIRLFKITGDMRYRNRAEKIFFTAKSHFQYFNNHYCWNYFDPLTPDDIDLQRKESRHFVDVHPWRSGYQASEVEKIVEAYHYGIVFDEQDIQRIINTNLEVMWNKDKKNPMFINSNGKGADNDTAGIAAFKAAYGHSTVYKNAGELWTGLLDFSQTIRDLYELGLNKADPIERINYENTTLKNPPDFKRKYVKGNVTVPELHFTECKALNLAVALPHTISPKTEKSILVCQTRIPGLLNIDVYNQQGKKIQHLYNGRIAEGIFMITWNGKDGAGKLIGKGNYTVRWTIANGYREFPVVIQ
ncbi:MAG: FlgD immunoglobulin-like domain containing protein, partial [Flavitalea sp.]